MGSFVFTAVAGKFNEKVDDAPTTVGLLLLKTAEADATLRDRVTIADILAAANVEADFSNYARLTGITGTVTVDTANNRVSVDIPDQVIANAGGATNNTLAKAIAYIDEGGTDATRIALTGHDAVVTTVGVDLNIIISASGLARATAS